MLTIYFPERSEGLLSVLDEAIGSSKDQSPVRGARRENNDVRNGIPERKVPVIGNLSLPILPSLFSLAAIHGPMWGCGTAIDSSLTPRGKIGYESPATLPRRERTRSDKNLIREKDKHDEKEELVRFYSRRRYYEDRTKSLFRGFFFPVLSFL